MKVQPDLGHAITNSLRFAVVLWGCLVLTACPRPGVMTSAELGAPSLQTLQAGSVLYAENCAGCHGDLQKTRIQSNTLDGFKDAFKTVTVMRSNSVLQSMDSETIEKIQKAVKFRAKLVESDPALVDPETPPTAPTAPPSDNSELLPDLVSGSALYSQKCQTCHLPLAQSTVAGRSINNLDFAISNINSMKSIQLTEQQKVDIIASLGGTYRRSPASGPTSPPNPPPDSPPGEVPTGLVGDPIKGAQIYSAGNLCISCHGNLASTPKRGSTLAQLDWAIASIPSMAASASIRLLSPQDRADLIAALNQSQTPSGDAGGYSEIQVSSDLPVHDRSYMYEFLGINFFGRVPEKGFSYTISAERDISRILATNFFDAGGIHGGACSLYAEKCPTTGEPEQVRERMSYSVLRRGYVESSCERILFHNLAVQNALTRNLGADRSTVSPDRASIEVLAQAFLMGRETPQIVDRLMAIASSSKTASQSTTDQWRMVLLSLCKSPMGEIQ